MNSQIGREDFHDRPMVALRFLSDSFKGVDPAQSDIQRLVAQLVGGLGDAIGDLALHGEPITCAVEAECPGGEERPNEKRKASEELDERGASCVLTFKSIFRRQVV